VPTIIVHFPIALLIIAVAVDLLALAWPRREWLGLMATSLLALGAVAAWAALLSGREAADSVLLPKAAESIMVEHADWAQWTAWFYSALALVRLGVVWRSGILAQWTHRLLFLAAAAGLVLLFETGDRGAQLVYQYGVGVQAVDQSEMAPHDHGAHGDDSREDGGDHGHGDAEGGDRDHSHAHDSGGDHHGDADS